MKLQLCASTSVMYNNNFVCLRSTALEGAILQRGLFLKKVVLEDFKSNFTCVVTNAFGAAHKVIQLRISHCNHQMKKPKTMHERNYQI